MRIRRHPLQVVGNGWAIGVSTFCGERWYRLSSWKAYSKPLIKRLGVWDTGFRIGPILFWKEG